MKKVISFMLVALLVGLVSMASAASYSFVPGAAEIDVTGQTTQTVQLWLNNDVAFQASAYQLKFTFDNVEMTPAYTPPPTGYTTGAFAVTNFISGFGSFTSEGLVMLSPTSFGIVFGNTATNTAMAVANIHVLDITFNILSPDALGNGFLADVSLNSQIATLDDGFLKGNGAYLQVAGANGPDIAVPGAPIPIPGAIYLLASGLIGLIGLRRKV